RGRLDYSSRVAENSGPEAPSRRDDTLIVGVFGDHLLAREAILALEQAGVEPEAISVLARAPGEARSLDLETGASRDLEGVTSSHRVHDVLDWLASIGGALPGFGPVAGTGNLGLNVARARSQRGAVTGALVGLGLLADEAARYEELVLA